MSGTDLKLDQKGPQVTDEQLHSFAPHAKQNGAGDMDKATRLQIASDKIAHLADTVQALDKELNDLAVAIGDDLMGRVEVAFPSFPSIGPDTIKRLCALSRDLEPPERE